LLEFKVPFATTHVNNSSCAQMFIGTVFIHRTPIHIDRLDLKALIKHKYNHIFPILESNGKILGVPLLISVVTICWPEC